MLAQVQDPQVRQAWTKEYPAMNYKNAAVGLAPIAYKLGAFLSHPIGRTALCEPRQPLRFRQIMDSRQILIVNLAKGQLDADIANVHGGLLVSSLMHAALSNSPNSTSRAIPIALRLASARETTG
ncbi:hypothetical protein TRL7639_00955 [Falsiruegeria litorea R37]|uniref:Uncharacterized protein n=1 Tax=Falsiruegeria litorea R37 TaxID=1200284 RepID=A0A1Y5RVP6_9RHOB|nr:hypothetical protein TRL7639_00955 [Falsiruegeria litorea R37]